MPTVAQIETVCRNAKSVNEAAKALQCDWKDMLEFAQQRGIEIEYHKQGKEINKELLEILYSRFGCTRIAEMLGVDRTTVARELDRYKIKRRPSGRGRGLIQT